MPGGPAPGIPRADDQNVNPGQSVPGKYAGRRQKEAFSATDRCTSPDPDFSALPHRHDMMQRGRADHVQANSQVISARAQKVLDSKGPIERLSRRRQSFIKLFNH